MNAESRRTVQYFCMMDAAALGSLAASISLASLVPHLARVQQYYRMQEHRDPCYFELRLLEALATHALRTPHTVRISSLTANEDQLRIFRDACRDWNVLGEHTPPSLGDLLAVSGRYLARAGITPYYPSLHSATHEQFALAASDDSALTLSLASTAATLSRSRAPLMPRSGVLLLFTPTDAKNAAAAYTDLLAAHRSLGLCPVAAVGNEGILSHLLATGGATLDLTPFMDEESTEIPTSLGAHALLLAAPEQALPTLFAKGLPIALLGTLNQTKKLTFLYRGNTLTAPTLGFLRSLYTERMQNVTGTANSTPDADLTPRITEDESTLLGGIEVCKDSAHAVLTLATELVRCGAQLTDSALSVVLQCPAHATDTCMSEALSLVLGFHRAACELVLPTAHHALLTADVDVPRLSVFLAAKKGAPYPMEFPGNWQDARDHFYGD